jgi:oxygen-independent coproporphyrinogen-3 oxidase
MASGRCPGANGERAVPRGQWRAGGAQGFRAGPTRSLAQPGPHPAYIPPVVRHLYVHVPFCVRRCSYCDFSIAVRKRVPGPEYVEAVLAELRSADPGAVPRGEPNPGANSADPRAMPRGASEGDLDTLYLGGGTPSLLPAPELARLITSLLDAFHSTPSLDDVEVTLEANPEDVTDASVRTWRSVGVNRVSLGAQSFDDRVLQWMHRSHDAARIGDAVRTLRAAGIENISLDLIFGLPEELGRDWARDLDLACALRTAHVSLYGLTVEPRTPLDRWISRGATKLPADERYADEYLLAHTRLTADGFQFYEVSNAARDGFRSRHNSAYWTGRPYVGLGPAAHSFDGRARRWNIPAWEAYRRAIAEGRSPVESEEVLTPEQQELERMYLALRTSEGLSLTAPYRPLPPLTALDRPVTAQWLERGWVVAAGGRLKCTPEGWLRLDELVAKLFVAKELAT